MLARPLERASTYTDAAIVCVHGLHRRSRMYDEYWIGEQWKMFVWPDGEHVKNFIGRSLGPRALLNDENGRMERSTVPCERVRASEHTNRFGISVE